MLPFIFKPIPKELNKKLNFKPPISHIIIRTKKTLDSLEAKNRTNVARRPAKAKALDSLETKNRTNIARRPTKVKILDSLETKNRTNIPKRPAKVKTLDSLETKNRTNIIICLLYTSPSPRDRQKSRMPSSA